MLKTKYNPKCIVRAQFSDTYAQIPLIIQQHYATTKLFYFLHSDFVISRLRTCFYSSIIRVASERGLRQVFELPRQHPNGTTLGPSDRVPGRHLLQHEPSAEISRRQQRGGPRQVVSCESSN